MVNIISRMRKLRELLWIRVGPGSLVLPKEVTKISMEFHYHIEGGHRGAKKFWREMLPRIKYRNPSVPVEIKRHNNPTGPATLSIFTTTSSNPSSSSTSSPPPSTPSEASDSALPASTSPTPRATLVPDTTTPTHTFDIRMMPESEILNQLLVRTQATEIEATEEERQELEEIKEFKARSEKDRVEVREKLTKERREQELLRLARGEVSGATA